MGFVLNVQLIFALTQATNAINMQVMEDIMCTIQEKILLFALNHNLLKTFYLNLYKSLTQNTPLKYRDTQIIIKLFSTFIMVFNIREGFKLFQMFLNPHGLG